MTLKLDMSKAYDRVEWRFLHRIISAILIPADFFNLVVMCYVTSDSYSINLNGEIGQSFICNRGLKQGDPLSPYLYYV